MPSMQEKVDLITWVEGLPGRENLPGYEAVLTACAERYGNSPHDLAMILSIYTDMFRKSMSENVKQYHKETADWPSGGDLNPLFERALEGILLRMWTYASEYYQRYQAETVFQPVTDDLLGEFLRTASQDNDGEDDTTS